MNRNRVSIAALAVVAVLVSACSGGGASSAPATSAPGSAAAGLPTLAFIAQMQNPSQAYSWKMYQKNAAKYGFNVINLDNGGDVQ